jgi:hypothetical protein
VRATVFKLPARWWSVTETGANSHCSVPAQSRRQCPRVPDSILFAGPSSEKMEQKKWRKYRAKVEGKKMEKILYFMW